MLHPPCRQDLYLIKKEEVDSKSKRVVVGLDKLKKGAADVELMKVRLETSGENASTTA